jgi:nitrogen fixation protein FixH
MDTTVWRWFPVGLIAAMAMVFAVNGYMVYDALTTFPGTAGQDGFDLSNNYDRIIATAQQQAALGWRIEADVTNTHIPELRLTGRNGTPLPAAAIDAHAERPLGSPDTTVLTFRPIGDGRFQATTTLFSGQWDIMLTIHADGQWYSTTRRVIVK